MKKSLWNITNKKKKICILLDFRRIIGTLANFQGKKSEYMTKSV